MKVKCMKKLNELLSIPIKISPTTIVLLMLMVYLFGILKGLVYFTVLVSSFLIHEMAHAYGALKNNVKVRVIRFSGFGCLAFMEDKYIVSDKIAYISAIGPITSVLFGMLCFFINILFPSFVLYLLLIVNIIIGLINFLPFIPFDGGKIVYGIVSLRNDKLKVMNGVISYSVCAHLLGFILCVLYMGFYTWWALLFGLFILITLVSYINFRKIYNSIFLSALNC